MTYFDFKWQTTGIRTPTELAHARRQLHNGVQFIARVGRYMLPPEADDSHTSMRWNSRLKLMIGGRLPAHQSVSVAFDCTRLSLLLLNKKLNKIWELGLNQLTNAEILALLRSELSKYGPDSNQIELNMHYEMEDAMHEDEAYDQGDKKDLQEISLYFDNAYSALESVTKKFKDSTVIRCWPHHFDMATLITLDPDSSGEEVRSVGVGFSVGDSVYPQPYFYVNIWPYPDLNSITLPPLESGTWHTKGWIGAVLCASEIIANNAGKQLLAVDGFLHTAIDSGIRILESHRI